MMEQKDWFNLTKKMMMDWLKINRIIETLKRTKWSYQLRKNSFRIFDDTNRLYNPLIEKEKGKI